MSCILDFQVVNSVMKIAIVIPVFNRKETTLNCLKQLESVDFCGNEIDVVVVDDGSTDGTEVAISEIFPVVTVLHGDGDLWWTGAINKGIEYAMASDFDGVLLLNDDLDLNNDFICELLHVVKNNPDVLVSSLKLVKRKNGCLEIITAGFKVEGTMRKVVNNKQGEVYVEANTSSVEECEILTGASLYIPRKVFEVVGLMDFKNFPHNWGDIEFTRRASLAGFRCLVAMRSHVFTEYNPNYHRTYITSSTRHQYVCNLFDNHKYNYGLKFLRKVSFMHKPFLIGVLVYTRGLVRTMRYLLLKLMLPKSILKRYMDVKLRNM